MEQAAPARSFGKVFDRVAADYDRSRPAYPDELVEEACERAGLGAGDPVLEIGCATGQLTRSLVERGLRVTAVEPGGRLLRLAARNVQDAGDVEFVHARFEDAVLRHGHFRAVFSAAAFQWTDPTVSWEKAAHLLAQDGTLALIQHCGLTEERSRSDQEELLSALWRVAPELAAGWPVYRELDAIGPGVEQRRANVSEVWAWVGSHDVATPSAAGLFCDVAVASTPWVMEHTGPELNALLRTASFYARLSPEQRRAIEHEHLALHRRLGRPIRSGMVAVLVTARRA